MTDEFSLEHNSNNQVTGHRNRLARLKSSCSSYRRVEKLFREGWKHPKKARPRVRAVFKILSPEDSLKPYLTYRARVHLSASLQSTSNLGNESLLFHGTQRACLIGEDPKNVQPCSLPECSLCCILRSSFSVKKCGSKHKFTRFGTGIYTTACSSKADDYSSNKSQKATFRVLLVTRVVVGRPHRRKRNATRLRRPPTGYNSVVGEPGEDLNYEETVVYRNDAIRPAYLVVYSDAPKGILKLKKFLSAVFSSPIVS